MVHRIISMYRHERKILICLLAAFALEFTACVIMGSFSITRSNCTCPASLCGGMLTSLYTYSPSDLQPDPTDMHPKYSSMVPRTVVHDDGLRSRNFHSCCLGRYAFCQGI